MTEAKRGLFSCANAYAQFAPSATEIVMCACRSISPPTDRKRVINGSRIITHFIDRWFLARRLSLVARNLRVQYPGAIYRPGPMMAGRNGGKVKKRGPNKLSAAN